MSNKAYTIGVDFGTDSVRSILVDTSNGVEICSSVFYYPRWKEGKFCNASINQFRQHPQDYIDGLEKTISTCVEQAGPSIASLVKAIGVDTTGSSPVAVDQSGQPLALKKEFEENPTPCLCCGKIILPYRKQQRSINTQKNVQSTIYNLWVAFIPANGSGPNFCTYFEKMKR